VGASRRRSSPRRRAERVLREAQVLDDAPADQVLLDDALGLIFYEMLAGQHPFDVNLPSAALFELQRNRRPPPLRDKNPDCDASEDLEWVIMRLLAKAPEERYQDAVAVIAAIDGAMQGIQGFLQRRESHRPPAGAPTRSAVLPVDRLRAPRLATRLRGAEWWTRIEKSWLLGGAVRDISSPPLSVVIRSGR
jgi:serine/threonine protein kinase